MQDDFSLDAYDFELPKECIAQHPAARRDDAKLLVLNKTSATIEHRRFSDVVHYFNQGDVLVLNDTKVFPARFIGYKKSGGKIEIFLLDYPTMKFKASSPTERHVAETKALLRCSKKPAAGSVIHLSDTLFFLIGDIHSDGHAHVELHFSSTLHLEEALLNHGLTPLPPYIDRPEGQREQDRKRYQTIYANRAGAVAAPTAGLHFTQDLLEKIKRKGVEIAPLTLHVGYGTFAPVRQQNIERHKIHSEFVFLTEESATRINQAKKRGNKIWAVGTTSTRALEWAARGKNELSATKGRCDLYIIPGHRFSVVDNLITNFHLPKSSLLFLVSAFCSRKMLLSCYHEAIQRGYRFYSYGDAMAIIEGK
ncbi:unnamed protein product [Cyprideis torosa]|uniref:Uncharacterized protein n=1 Tax=Cyprideis torosa TaxID=163714 RepID=A0A7R8ZTV7_9CRUS|nr:unnamed protein product [Cyprideis torosa]CAG0898997.1 unnamed protein product [Cyprideis torosa]